MASSHGALPGTLKSLGDEDSRKRCREMERVFQLQLLSSLALARDEKMATNTAAPVVNGTTSMSS